MKVTVFSTYMPNIPSGVVDLQREVVNCFLPRGWQFQQIKHERRHPEAMYECVDNASSDICIFLDVDCIPLTHYAFEYLLDPKWGVAAGSLVGAAQRANHIRNNEHLYVGPFLMAFAKKSWEALGKPKFDETWRGDVGEELTYVWEKAKRPIYFFWPSDVQKPMWNLIDNVVKFGLGTTYENIFYHSFCIRDKANQNRFIIKCTKVLESERQGTLEKAEV